MKNHHVFSSDENPPFTPELFRLPGYPIFLMLINSTEPVQFQKAIAVQGLIGVILLFLGWPLMQKIGGKKGATLGAIILVWDLTTLLHSPVILSELWLQLLLTAGIVSTSVWMANKSRLALILAGVFWALAGLTKPIALFIPIVIFIFNLSNIKQSLFFLLFSMSLPLSWAIRNSSHVGQAVYTTQGGYALLLYPAANAYAMSHKIDIKTATQILTDQIKEKNPNLIKGSLQEGKAYEKEAKEIMRQYPIFTMRYCLAGAARILGGTGVEMILELFGWDPSDSKNQKADEKLSGQGTFQLLKNFPLLIPFQVGYMFFLLASYFFFIKGVIRLFLEGMKRFALIAFFSVGILLAIASHQGYYRFRIPLIPFIAFAASASWYKKKNSAHSSHNFQQQ